jgi:hypothetical protein
MEGCVSADIAADSAGRSCAKPSSGSRMVKTGCGFLKRVTTAIRQPLSGPPLTIFPNGYLAETLERGYL